jgi:hypothetical protein
MICKASSGNKELFAAGHPKIRKGLMKNTII